MLRKTAIFVVVGVALSTVGLVVPARAVTAATRDEAPYAGPGPFAAGVTTLDMDGTPVEVWYPVKKSAVKGRDKDVYYVKESLPAALQGIIPASVNPPFTEDAYRDVEPSKKGPFPLVLFSHGFAGFRLQSTFLTSHLAQWGFVVAAPEFASRNLASVLGIKPSAPRTDSQVFAQTTRFVRQQSATAASLLAGTVKRGKVAVTGHSAGGFAAIEFARRPNVVTYIPLSAGGAREAGPNVETPDKPSLYALGGDDQVVGTARVEQYWRTRAKAPKRLVVIAGAGHTSPTDTCDIGSGGLVQTAIDAGLAIPASFGALYDCMKPVLARDTWPVYDHFVTAQLRWAFRIDASPVGLNQRAAKSFRPLRVLYRQRL